MAEHKLDIAKVEKRAQAAIDLKSPHSPPKSVAELRARVDLIEDMLGI